MINIQDIIPFMKDGWVAMDSNGDWWWWQDEPEQMLEDKCWWKLHGDFARLSASFDIAPADDWAKSLIKVGEK